MPKHSFITELIWSARLICLTAQRIAAHDCFNAVGMRSSHRNIRDTFDSKC